jgi:hypothetical protein
MLTNYQPKWIPLFPNGERNIPSSEMVGFEKKKDGYSMGGCYLYAFDKTGDVVNRTPNHLDQSIVYIGTAGSSKHRGIVSRTQDFTTTIIRGNELKNPYANGIHFRIQEGVENRKFLYASYIPMGYGPDVKLKAHERESQLLSDYKNEYGSLPAFNTDLCTVGMMCDMYAQLSEEQRQTFLRNIENSC